MVYERQLNFQCPQLLLGNGIIERIGEEACSLGAKKCLIVTDKGVVKAGLLERIQEPLKRSNLEVVIFDQVEPDPPAEVIQRCLNFISTEGIDLVIGLGGGSSLDVAKMVAVMVVIGGSIEDYVGIEKIPAKGIPTILIPTTAGTGSEVSPNAIFSFRKEKLKKGVVSKYLYANVALVDPLLTVTLPPKITASTGMDALCHAIETYTSIKATPFTDALALKSIQLIGESLTRAVSCGDDVAARYNMSTASLLAGLNLAPAGTGAVHALAYPLGGMFDIPHGIANGLLLPYVMEFNRESSVEKFAEIAQKMESVSVASIEEIAQRAVEIVRKLSNQIGMPQRLRDLGIPREAIPELAQGAMKVTRLLANNPREVKMSDAIRIYENAY